MLCSLCEALDFDKLHYEWSPSGYAHHGSFAELAACTNCRFCGALHDTIKGGPQLGGSVKGDDSWRTLPLFLRVIPTSDAIGTEDDVSNLLVFAQAPPEQGGNPVYLAMFGLLVDRTAAEWKTGERDLERCKHAQGIKGRPVSAFSNADECFELLRMWLHRCLEEQSPQESPFVPTRTVDVGPPDGTQEPRLVVHPTNSAPFHWVTLSHCWGGSSPLTTNAGTLQEWTDSGIPMLLLPPTFRDAVSITRRLGYRHLWIDSLCIIQYSREDWEREALRMGDVYRYGELNISASAAHNCHEGIFSKRDNPASFSSAVRLPFRSARLNIGLGHREWMYVRAGKWDSFREQITGAESTLASRGWVLQEALLSPRTVHYSRRQIFWECEHGTFAEGRVDALARPSARSMLLAPMPGLWSHKMVLPTHAPREVLTSAEEEKDMVETYASWLQVVENYSARQLTVLTDVLPALAGAASVFQVRLNDSYLAGLFRGPLLESLLWRAKTGTPVTQRPGANLPSWSWGSIVGGVTFEVSYSSNVLSPVLVGSATAKIIQADTFLPNGETSPPHHLSSVDGGRLVIQGHIVEGAELVARNYRSAIDSLPPSDSESRTLQSFIDTEAPVARHIILLHLGIWQWVWNRGSRSRYDRTYGGLLLQATDESRTTYKRIGIAMLKVRDGTGYRELTPNDEEVVRRWERRSVAVV
ncbi:heterokaryon incompatibility protein-domain-containing protein [Immersiella caudata]|uniref:Heterokaryon incompatibility protein-domain-containing protein n=1 Tax=Immersiella caudata TaxID=314043 RepID=A0AA40C0P1_9PEZI|nr:heterokaryon incompatibility protein-domain-containing protein [Immersiella caudata]